MWLQRETRSSQNISMLLVPQTFGRNLSKYSYHSATSHHHYYTTLQRISSKTSVHRRHININPTSSSFPATMTRRSGAVRQVSSSTNSLASSSNTGAGGAGGLQSLTAIPEWMINTFQQHPVASIGSVAFLAILAMLQQYRGAIQRRLRMIREESWLFGAGVTVSSFKNCVSFLPLWYNDFNAVW